MNWIQFGTRNKNKVIKKGIKYSMLGGKGGIRVIDKKTIFLPRKVRFHIRRCRHSTPDWLPHSKVSALPN